MKAVIIKERGKAELVEIAEQDMRHDYVKVKTVCVAINPGRSHLFLIRGGIILSDMIADYYHTVEIGLVGGISGK
jgi:hypothetical protein